MSTDSIEEDLYQLVLTLSGVTGYLGSTSAPRVYHVDAPGGDLTLPYITYRTISAPGESMYYNKDSQEIRVQWDIWHDELQNGLDLANALREGLHRYSGTPDSYYIYYIVAAGPITMRDPAYDNIYHYVVDTRVEYER